MLGETRRPPLGTSRMSKAPGPGSQPTKARVSGTIADKFQAKSMTAPEAPAPGPAGTALGTGAKVLPPIPSNTLPSTVACHTMGGPGAGGPAGGPVGGPAGGWHTNHQGPVGAPMVVPSHLGKQAFKIELNIISASGLGYADLFKKSDPYVRFHVPNLDPKSNYYTEGCTRTAPRTHEPVWNFKKVFDFSGMEDIKLEVWDRDCCKKDDSMGTASLPVQAALNGFMGELPIVMEAGKKPLKGSNNPKVYVAVWPVRVNSKVKGCCPMLGI